MYPFDLLILSRILSYKWSLSDQIDILSQERQYQQFLHSVYKLFSNSINVLIFWRVVHYFLIGAAKCKFNEHESKRNGKYDQEYDQLISKFLFLLLVVNVAF